MTSQKKIIHKRDDGLDDQTVILFVSMLGGKWNSDLHYAIFVLRYC